MASHHFRLLGSRDLLANRHVKFNAVDLNLNLLMSLDNEKVKKNWLHPLFLAVARLLLHGRSSPQYEKRNNAVSSMYSNLKNALDDFASLHVKIAKTKDHTHLSFQAT